MSSFKLDLNIIKINILTTCHVDPIKTVPSRMYTSRKLTDGRLGNPHVRRTSHDPKSTGDVKLLPQLNYPKTGNF